LAHTGSAGWNPEVEGSGQQPSGQQDLDHVVSCRAQRIPSFSTAKVTNGKNCSQDAIHTDTEWNTPREREGRAAPLSVTGAAGQHRRALRSESTTQAESISFLNRLQN